MSKKIFRRLSKEQKKELVGFEEVVDMVFDSNIDLLSKKDRNLTDKSSDNYELYNYLENENNRLKKIDYLCAVIIPNIEINSQTQNLVDIQKENLKMNKERTALSIMSEESIFIKNISDIYDRVFKEI